MNSGRANKAAIRLLLWSVVGLLGFFAVAWVGKELGAIILAFHKVFLAIWALFAVLIVYLSRDPDPVEPTDLAAIVAPAHGKVDVIEDTVENEFMKGTCKRVSIRVSLLDVQVQYAPLTATVSQFEHRLAMKEGGGAETENLFLGLDVVGRPETKAALRLIGGTWGRRIMPWIRSGDVISRSERISMMRPASRVDVYLPSIVKLHINVGDEVAGGQSVIGKFD